MKPIIKWIGGKTQLLPEIIENLPREGFDRYIEPFLGGGAVLFELRPEKVIVNDLNAELMNLYNVVKLYPKALMNKLDYHEKNHSEEYFYKVRELDRFVGLSNLHYIYRASRFIFLNKAGFNGMYRVNSKNEMNVPFNEKKHVSLYDKKNINKISGYFNSSDVHFFSKDYYILLEEVVRKGDFIYIDPPYDPINKTSNFTAYQKSGFTTTDQRNLRDMCIEIHNRGAKFLLSNSDTELINDLYNHEDFIINKVYASRRINSNGKGRGKVKEVLIRNYKIGGE